MISLGLESQAGTHGEPAMQKKKKIIPLLLIFIGLALLLGALFFWIDTLTSAEPTKLSESIRDWLTLLLGLGASLKGWIDLLKKEKSAPATEIKVTGGSPQIATGENDRNIQVQTYIEKQIIQGQEAPSSRDYLHQLPPPPADFTGRADEIEQLLAALSDGKRAAISGLSGMGGIGKTALGLAVAQRLCGQFCEAQIFLDLKGTTDPLAPADAMRYVLFSFFPTTDLRALDDAQLAAAYRDAMHGKKGPALPR